MEEKEVIQTTEDKKGEVNSNPDPNGENDLTLNPTDYIAQLINSNSSKPDTELANPNEEEAKNNTENQNEKDQPKEEAKKQEEKVIKEDDKSKPETTEITSVIDDKLIESFPQLRALRGKDLIKDMPQIYADLAKGISRQGQDMAELRKEIASKNQTIKDLQNQINQSKQVQNTGDDNDELPDMYEDPKGYTKALREKITREIINEIKKDNPVKSQAETSKPAVDNNQKETLQLDNSNTADPKVILDHIQNQLPKEVDAKQIIDDFVKANSRKFYDRIGNLRSDTSDYYNRNPDVFIDDVIEHYSKTSDKSKTSESEKLVKDLQKQIDDLKKEMDIKVKEKTYEHTKRNIKQSQTMHPEGSNVNLTGRNEPELTKENILLRQLPVFQENWNTEQ